MDFRGKTFGPFDAALDGVARVRASLKEPLHGVLGNHDTVCMVPALEDTGIRIPMHEFEVIECAGERKMRPDWMRHAGRRASRRWEPTFKRLIVLTL